MANALYPLYLQACLTNSAPNLATDSIKVVALSSAYTYSSAHQYLSSVTGTVATSAAFTSVTDTSGVFAAANVTLSAVTGSAIASLVIYKDTGTASTSQLIAYIDTATGLPVTPNGGDITITWDSGANKIFAL